MTTTYLPNKNVGYPDINDTGWGLVADASYINIDSALGGVQTFNLAAAAGTVSVSATSYNGSYPANAASYIPLQWVLTGALTASVTLQIPSGVGGQWIVDNQCTMGAFTITFAASGGSTSVSLTTGVQPIYSDGAGNIKKSSFAALNSPTFTGTPAAPTASPGTNTTQIATTAFVAASYAPKASPALTGNPTAPTAAVNTNTTQIATTAFVQNQIASGAILAPLAITGGLPTAMSGTNTTASINVSAATAVDITNSSSISYAGGTWSVSNGNAINGYAGGTTLPNSSTIHVYLCKGSSGVGLYASTAFNLSAGSAPANYNSYIRRAFSFTTNSSGAPVAYTAFESAGGGYIAYLSSIIQDITPPITTIRTNYAVSVPTGMRVGYIARVYAVYAGSAVPIYVFSPDEATPAAAGDLFAGDYASVYVTTNASAQVSAFASTSGGTSVSLYMRGFEDFRRA